jgi:hypothetical protein
MFLGASQAEKLGAGADYKPDSKTPRILIWSYFDFLIFLESYV